MTGHFFFLFFLHFQSSQSERSKVEKSVLKLISGLNESFSWYKTEDTCVFAKDFYCWFFSDLLPSCHGSP